MTKRNSTPEAPVLVKKHRDRFLKVSLCPEPKPRIPWLRIRGLWLKEAGFNDQTIVRVRVMYGCLVITADSGDD